MKRNILHRNEKELVRALFKCSQPVTVNELSEETGMSWVTVKKYLIKLIERRVVEPSRARKFELSRELLEILYKRKHGSQQQ